MYSHTIAYKQVNSGYQPRSVKIRKLISKIFLIKGMLIMTWVSYPLLKFQLINSQQLSNNQFLTPMGNNPVTLAAETNDQQVDYTQATNWFPQAHFDSIQSNVDKYNLSIPKLGIQGATVNLKGEDLSKGLVHYGGTAIPGTNGNGVIFGHSILPQFYNPENYMAIFSTLHKLDKGDQILLNYDGITYQYQVIDMFEVKPDEIWVLDQDKDNKYISLITCTPPGTYLRRLVVKAKLVPYQQAI